ncbi:MAG: UPF0149 family protein [Ramlibacter sp.]|nr:UPF0149 family protein [Ramlibacter sp.]
MQSPLSTNFWTEADVERLDDFFLRDGGPENTMDTPMLDGFLCAVVSGPTLIMPTEMLRWVTDTENGRDPPVFRSAKEASEITELIMRQWNAINEALTHSPESYEPLLFERQTDAGTVHVIDEWCMGYYKGIELDFQGWTPMLVGQPELLSPILLYGTEEGWDALKIKKLSYEEHEAIAGSLGDLARAIHAHWLEQRKAQRAGGLMPDVIRRRETVRREGPKIGRNDPCPCGSGRKYKQCHGAA